MPSPSNVPLNFHRDRTERQLDTRLDELLAKLLKNRPSEDPWLVRRAYEIAERIRKNVCEHTVSGCGTEHRLCVSVGVIWIDGKVPITLEALLAESDQRMYSAKRWVTERFCQADSGSRCVEGGPDGAMTPTACSCAGNCAHGFFCHTSKDSCLDDSDCAPPNGRCNFEVTSQSWMCTGQICPS